MGRHMSVWTSVGLNDQGEGEGEDMVYYDEDVDVVSSSFESGKRSG